jgi:hypothetical protein
MGRTKQDVKIAARVGKSAATVERHRLQGMWPADPLARIERHYEVIEECGLGPGRDNWTVAVDAAEHFDWPIVLLRSLLTGPPPRHLIAPGFHERIRAVLVGVAQGIDGIANYTEPATCPTVDLAEAVVDDAYRAVGKTLDRAPTEAEDFVDLGEIVQTLGERAEVEGFPDDESETTDRSFEADLRDFWSAHAGRFTPDTPWATEAEPAKLASAVRMAAQLVDLCNTVSPSLASTGDARRAEVVALAPTCGVILDVVPEVTDGGYSGPEIIPVILDMQPPLNLSEVLRRRES